MATAEAGAGQPATNETTWDRATPMAMPGDAAVHTDQHRLGQELQQHVQPEGTDRHAQSDLAGPLGDRDQPDVHDSDAANEQ